jgi:propanol-preferring alcohol dehydrogenase
VFAPAGELVAVALGAVRAGGTVALAGIHMSDLPTMPYELLWHERSLRSVANMTRDDAQEFMDLAAVARLRVAHEVFPLAAANDALLAIKRDAVRGAAVLQVT